MLATMSVIKENMYKAAQGGFINATDLADYLTKRGMPFRTAYKIVGEIVAECIAKGCVLDTLPLADYKKHTDIFEEDLFGEISLETCVSKRISAGGTSVESVEEQIAYVKKELKK
jgi:argininosuccinate lyase